MADIPETIVGRGDNHLMSKTISNLISSPKFINNPLVSVFIITYNQEQTISQTIEGVLMQDCNFSVEMIIAEDGSNDGTRNVCRDYQKSYPEKVKLLMQETNQGLLKNYIDGIRLCRGKYIAQCAGDDYWIDPLKIAKQVKYLEENPECGVVSTGGYRLIVKSNKMVEGIAPLDPVTDGNVFHLTYKGGVYAMPLSLMFRSELLKYIDFEEFIKRKFSCEDVPMQAIFAKHTKFGHIPDLTCVYRVYNESMTFTTFHSPNYLHYHEGLVAIRRYLDELFPGEVEFSEQWAHDYLVYKRFLLSVFHFDYAHAKSELAKLMQINFKERRAIAFSKTRIGFYLFCFLKRIKSRML
jgi:glycosyltransferase involved in cell wall biosynthesis